MFTRILRTSLAALSAGIVALSIGCATPDQVGTVQRRNDYGRKEYVADKRLNFNRAFRSVFEVGDTNSHINDAGLLMVQTRVTNYGALNEIIEYKFDWTDENGMLFETPSSRWLIKHIEPGESVLIMGIAPNPKVSDFYLKLQQKK